MLIRCNSNTLPNAFLGVILRNISLQDRKHVDARWSTAHARGREEGNRGGRGLFIISYDGRLRALETSGVMMCACFAEDDLILASIDFACLGSRNHDIGRHFQFPRGQRDTDLKPVTQWSRRVASEGFSGPWRADDRSHYSWPVVTVQKWRIRWEY